MDEFRAKLKGYIDQAIDELSEASKLLQEPVTTAPSYIDKLNAILQKYKKIRKLAYDLDVDVRTIRRWLQGTTPNKKNRRKIDALYHKLFGDG